MVEGPYSDRCAVAWDIVEELKAADADHRKEPTGAYELSYIPLGNHLLPKERAFFICCVF